MDNVEKYNPEKHEAEVVSWYAAHGLEWNPKSISTNGWIVPGAAAVWLYVTDSIFCYVDNAVTNPKAKPEVRGAALDAVGDALHAHAKDLGYQFCLAFVGKEGLLPRMEQHHGYQRRAVSLMLKKDL